MLKDMTDFPVFQHWNFNRKIFEPRALNHLSTRFNWYIEYEIEHYLDKDNTVDWLVNTIVKAARYAYFGNASYEAEGPGSYGGGNDSIQEQFVCWALDIPKETYRSGGRTQYSYGEDLFHSKVIRDWVESSQLYKYVRELID